MKIDVKYLKDFNKNKTKERYSEIENEYFPNDQKCEDCNSSIYYYDSTFRNSLNGELKKIGKSCHTVKKVDEISYTLSICEDCLIKKFPIYNKKNKSRVFNMMNDITSYAFKIPIDIKDNWKKLNYNRTEESYIKKYGEEIGLKKWNKYKEKQSYTNKFEYKKEKYGWTKKEFDDYNKSRSVTLYNLIDKYGESDGIKMWDNYINKQRITKSKEYVINKYGKSYWDELCLKKSNSLKGIINRKGKEKGIKFYKNLFNNILVYPPSKSSQSFFKKIDLILGKRYKTYFFDKNEEYCIFDDDLGFIFLDYYIKDLNVSIEFNGDIWHANPTKYKEDDIIPVLNIKAKDIWDKDEKRYNNLKNNHNITTIVVWENDKPDINDIIKIIKDNE